MAAVATPLVMLMVMANITTSHTIIPSAEIVKAYAFHLRGLIAQVEPVISNSHEFYTETHARAGAREDKETDTHAHKYAHTVWVYLGCAFAARPEDLDKNEKPRHERAEPVQLNLHLAERARVVLEQVLREKANHSDK